MSEETKAEPKFKVGDVVRLKSGGPNMTISEVYPSGCYQCTWFDQSGETFTFNVEAFSFYEDMLTK